MRVAGIIAEYNPFHSGHAWQLQQVKSMGYDAAVCVVSPGVCQRGSVCLYPAAVRVQAALAGGADLVLTLPSVYATAGAEQFAAAAVHLLSSLGVVEAVCFGAETPDAALLAQTAHNLYGQPFKEALRIQLKKGIAFAAARSAALEMVQPGAGAILRSPNNILGIEYCKAILMQQSNLCAVALPRQGAAHDAPLAGSTAQAGPGSGIASATALRALCGQSGAAAMAPYVPAACLPLYLQAEASGQTLDRQKFDIAVLSRLRAMSAADFAKIRGVGEGLENRLAAAVQYAANTDELYTALKSKRYAHARLRRLVLDAALGVHNDVPPLPPYLHLAGANATGLMVLKQAKGKTALPMADSLAQLRGQSAAAQTVGQYHAAAESLSALCRTVPQPAATAYTQKFITCEE